MKRLTGSIPERKINIEKWSHLQNIMLVDPHFNTPAAVDMIIGADNYGKIILSGIMKGEGEVPYAQSTHLGWIVMGKTSSSTRRLYHA